MLKEFKVLEVLLIADGECIGQQYDLDCIDLSRLERRAIRHQNAGEDVQMILNIYELDGYDATGDDQEWGGDDDDVAEGLINCLAQSYPSPIDSGFCTEVGVVVYDNGQWMNTDLLG